MESKILDLIIKVKKVAPSLSADDHNEVLALAEEARKEYLEEIGTEIINRQVLIQAQENVMLVLDQFMPEKKELITGCEVTITLANQSIIMYKELEDEIKQS